MKRIKIILTLVLIIAFSTLSRILSSRGWIFIAFGMLFGVWGAVGCWLAAKAAWAGQAGWLGWTQDERERAQVVVTS